MVLTFKSQELLGDLTPTLDPYSCGPLEKFCYVLFEVANITDKPIKQLPVTLLKTLV